MQYLEDQKEKTQYIKLEIDNIEQEINQMVYELYGLNEHEINIVEKATE